MIISLEETDYWDTYRIFVNPKLIEGNLKVFVLSSEEVVTLQITKIFRSEFFAEMQREIERIKSSDVNIPALAPPIKSKKSLAVDLSKQEKCAFLGKKSIRSIEDLRKVLRGMGERVLLESCNFHKEVAKCLWQTGGFNSHDYKLERRKEQIMEALKEWAVPSRANLYYEGKALSEVAYVEDIIGNTYALFSGEPLSKTGQTIPYIAFPEITPVLDKKSKLHCLCVKGRLIGKVLDVQRVGEAFSLPVGTFLDHKGKKILDPEVVQNINRKIRENPERPTLLDFRLCTPSPIFRLFPILSPS